MGREGDSGIQRSLDNCLSLRFMKAPFCSIRSGGGGAEHSTSREWVVAVARQYQKKQHMLLGRRSSYTIQRLLIQVLRRGNAQSLLQRNLGRAASGNLKRPPGNRGGKDTEYKRLLRSQRRKKSRIRHHITQKLGGSALQTKHGQKQPVRSTDGGRKVNTKGNGRRESKRRSSKDSKGEGYSVPLEIGGKHLT